MEKSELTDEQRKLLRKNMRSEMRRNLDTLETLICELYEIRSIAVEALYRIERAKTLEEAQKIAGEASGICHCII